MFSEQSAEVQELLVGGFVVFMMMAVGIDLTVQKIKAVFQRPAILCMALLVNYALVPLLFLGLLRLFDVQGMWAVGILFVAVAPGGPVAGVLIQHAGGNLALGVSLLVLMNLLNTVLTPMGILAMEASASSSLPLGGMVKTIVLFQLIPLAITMVFRHLQPERAIRLQPTIERAAKVLLFAASAVMLSGEIPRLMNMPFRLVALCHVAVPAVMAAGWFMTPGNREERIAVAIATPYRSISVVLLLLASWVRDMDAIFAAMTYSGAMLWMCLTASAIMRRRQRQTLTKR
jgi:BASS family bile acid:Na+ symporter